MVVFTALKVIVVYAVAAIGLLAYLQFSSRSSRRN
jgi:hypothetical protein